MNDLSLVAPAFVEMAHRIVWCTAATVDSRGRPRSRVLHPMWQWDGEHLVGWICTTPTPMKREHLQASPNISINYWSPTHDTCLAECRATWILNDDERTALWSLFLSTPTPVGYDPRLIPAWTSPTCEAFAGLKLAPWRLRVFPGTVLLGKGGQVLKWRQPDTNERPR